MALNIDIEIGVWDGYDELMMDDIEECLHVQNDGYLHTTCIGGYEQL